MIALAGFYTPEIFQSGRILTMEGDDGEEDEDVAPEYAQECLDEWYDTIEFLDEWEAGIFTVSLSEKLAMPCALMDARRVHKHWIMEQRAQNRKK